jgi:hypothetical protein
MGAYFTQECPSFSWVVSDLTFVASLAWTFPQFFFSVTCSWIDNKIKLCMWMLCKYEHLLRLSAEGTESVKRFATVRTTEIPLQVGDRYVCLPQHPDGLRGPPTFGTVVTTGLSPGVRRPDRKNSCWHLVRSELPRIHQYRNEETGFPFPVCH